MHIVAAHGADMHHIAGKAGIGAAFGNNAHLLGDYAAVHLHAQLESDALRHAGTCCLEVLQPVVDQPHRAPGMQGQQAGQQLVVVLHDLAAEAASGSGLNHTHAGNGQTQGHGHLHAHQIHGLGRGIEHQPAIGVQRSHRGHGLHIAGVLRMRGVSGFVDQIRGGKACLHVTALELDMLGHIVASRVDAEGLLVHGLLGRENGGQLLVLDPDQIQRIACNLVGHGGHGSHFLATITHHTLGQDGSFLVMRPPECGRRILTGQNRLDARQRARLGSVYANDARMRVRAAQNLAMQHAGKLEISSVDGPAKHLGLGRYLRSVHAQRGSR